jgi:hypothetical protein
VPGDVEEIDAIDVVHRYKFGGTSLIAMAASIGLLLCLSGCVGITESRHLSVARAVSEC